METKHTKGEWFANNCTVTIQGSFKEIARCYSDDEKIQATQNYHEMRANAKLIAAAPELLEALMDMRIMFNQWIEQDKETKGYKWAEKALNAINKATK